MRASGRHRWARTGRVRAVFTTGVVGAALVATAVSGGSAAAASGVLGTPHEATGSPVTIAVISDGGSGSSIGTAALVEQGAKMGVAYENAYNDGLNGHKINLYICENQSTPAGGQACANDVVQKSAVAVTVPFTGQGATEVPTIVKAGIPYISLSGSSTPELTTPGAYALTGGFPADLGAFALSAKAHGYKKVTFLVENVPAAIQGAQVLGGLVFKNAGVGFAIAPVNPGTADLSPQLQSAISGGASAIGVVGDVTLCSSFLQAYNTLGTHIPKYVLGTCQDPSIENSPSLDKALKGSYIATTSAYSAKDKALYAAIVHKFAPKVNPNPSASANEASGLVPVLTLEAVMKGFKGPITAAAINQQMTMAKGVPLPFGGGITFTCNGTAISLLKGVCSASAAVGIVGSGSSITGIKTYNPTSLF